MYFSTALILRCLHRRRHRHRLRLHRRHPGDNNPGTPSTPSLFDVVLDDSKFGLDFAKIGLRQILSHTVRGINLFQLISNFDISQNSIQTMICMVARMKVKEIDISSYPGAKCGYLPADIFKCNSVESLKLQGTKLNIPCPKIVYLLNLKVLRLHRICLPSMNGIIGGCPQLEELWLSDIYERLSDIYEIDEWTDVVDHLDVCIPSLRKFSFKNFLSDICGLKLTMDTPKLEFFEYVGEARWFYWENKPNFLDTAIISFTRVQDRENVCRFFSQLKGLNCLHLYGLALEIASQHCPSILKDVKSLELSEYPVEMVRQTPAESNDGTSTSVVLAKGVTTEGVKDVLDRLSCLPDELLLEILSKLNTKDAICACVTSRTLWGLSSSLPDIVLYDGYKEVDGIDGVGREFTEFCLRRVIFRHVVKIGLFQLRSVFHLQESGLETVVSLAAQETVREMDICCAGILSDCLFMSQPLQILKLTGRDLCVSVPQMVYLPNLQVLYLNKINLENKIDLESVDDDGIMRLLGKCTRLLELHMDEVYCFFGDLHVSIPTLETFSFKSSTQCLALHLDTPSLKELKYGVVEVRHLHWVNEPRFLLTAEIKFERVQDHANACRFFSGLKGLNCLQLSRLAVQIAQETPSIFERVKSLELKVDNLQRVRDIVGSAPKLEILVISSCVGESDQDELKRLLPCKVVFKKRNIDH